MQIPPLSPLASLAGTSRAVVHGSTGDGEKHVAQAAQRTQAPGGHSVEGIDVLAASTETQDRGGDGRNHEAPHREIVSEPDTSQDLPANSNLTPKIDGSGSLLDIEA